MTTIICLCGLRAGDHARIVAIYLVHSAGRLEFWGIFIGVANARRLAIADSRKNCYCQTSGKSKLFVNLLLPDVLYKICAEYVNMFTEDTESFYDSKSVWKHSDANSREKCYCQACLFESIRMQKLKALLLSILSLMEIWVGRRGTGVVKRLGH